MFLWFSKSTIVSKIVMGFCFAIISSVFFSLSLKAFAEETAFLRFWELVKKQRIKKIDDNVDQYIIRLADELFNELRSYNDIGLKISSDIKNLHSLLKKINEPLTFSKIYPIKNQIRTIRGQSKLLREKIDYGILQLDPLYLNKVDEFCEQLKVELNADKLDLGGAKERFKYFVYLLIKNYKPIFIGSITSLGLVATFATGLERKNS